MARRTWFIIYLVSILPAPLVAATPVVTFTGQVRVRAEYDDRTTTSPRSYFYTDMRTRFNITANIDSSVHAFIQFQDSRRFGALANDRPATSTSTDNKNVDLHQAWLAVDNFPMRNLRFQAGRFELSFGNERVIGAGDWHNVSRAFEGLILSLKQSNSRTDLFALQLIESTGGKLNEEYLVYGTNVSLQKLRLDLLMLYEYDNDGQYYDSDRLRRLSLGGYFSRQFGSLDFAANVLYQMGQLYAAPAARRQDIAASLLTAETGWTTASKRTRIAVGADFASGDGDASAGDMTAYDNLFYTGHKFRGFMDYFLTTQSTNYHGLLDFFARAKFEPKKGWVLRSDLHRFVTAKSFFAAGSWYTHELGWELDMVATTTRINGCKFETGAAAFFPDRDYFGRSADPGFWTYLSAVVDF